MCAVDPFICLWGEGESHSLGWANEKFASVSPRSLSISMSSASSMPSGSPVFIGCLKYTHLSTSPRLALSQQSLLLDGSIGAFWVWFPCCCLLSLWLGSCRLGSGAWRMGSEANSLTDNDEGQILKPYCLFFLAPLLLSAASFVFWFIFTQTLTLTFHSGLFLNARPYSD